METCDKLTHKRDAKSNCIQASARYWIAGRSALTNTMTKDIHALRTVQALTTLVTASIIVDVSAAAVLLLVLMYSLMVYSGYNIK
ncbi:hypothetical protein FF1_014137 [Malus domestica]